MMTQETGEISVALVGAYQPRAIFYQEADVVEYVRVDVPSVYRRVDQFLTLILDMSNRRLIGFSLKGFRNLYLTRIKPSHDSSEFLKLTTVLEGAVEAVGAAVFDDPAVRAAYSEARSIAESDKVELHELPEAA